MDPNQSLYPPNQQASLLPRFDIGNGQSVPIAPATPALQQAMAGMDPGAPAVVPGTGVSPAAAKQLNDASQADMAALGAKYGSPVGQQAPGAAPYSAAGIISDALSQGAPPTGPVSQGLGTANPPPLKPFAGSGTAAPRQQQSATVNPWAKHAGSAGGGAYPPGRFVPGEMQPSETETEYGPQLNPEGMAQRQAAFEKEQKANDLHYQAQVLSNTADVSEQKARAEAAQRTADNLATINAQKQSAVDAQLKTMADMRAERAQRVEQMGPNRFFRNIGTIPTILAAITRGVGAWGAYGPHGTGHDPGGKILDDAVARDMDSQKAEIAAFDGNLDAANNQLAQLYKQYGDKAEAERQWKIDAYDSINNIYSKFRTDARDKDTEAQHIAGQAAIQDKLGQLIGQDGMVARKRMGERFRPAHTEGGPGTLHQQRLAAEDERALYDAKNGKGAYDRDMGNQTGGGNPSTGAAADSASQLASSDPGGTLLTADQNSWMSLFAGKASADYGAAVDASGINFINAMSASGKPPRMAQAAWEPVRERLLSKNENIRRGAQKQVMETINRSANAPAAPAPSDATGGGD